ncbi:MAG: hypothetical protein ABW104_06930 [Candidatus Thiodiazotropha sp. 6PLUC2]
MLRLEFAVALYNITSCGERMESILEDDEDNQQFPLLLDKGCGTYN